MIKKGFTSSVDNARTKVIFVAIVVVAVLAYGCVGEGDYAAARDVQSVYCQMVEMYDQTGGQEGWPDYRGNAATACPAQTKSISE